jgi:hypothetical protein
MPTPTTETLPRGMLALGWSGLLPFIGTLALATLAPAWREVALTVFIAYAAIILSFLGGARWGRGLATTTSSYRYAEAVLPSLIGFAALLLAHRPLPALALLAGGFLIWLLIDLRDPLWSRAYRRMRLGISMVVLLLHAAWFVV